MFIVYLYIEDIVRNIYILILILHYISKIIAIINFKLFMLLSFMLLCHYVFHLFHDKNLYKKNKNFHFVR